MSLGPLLVVLSSWPGHDEADGDLLPPPTLLRPGSPILEDGPLTLALASSINDVMLMGRGP